MKKILLLLPLLFSLAFAEIFEIPVASSGIPSQVFCFKTPISISDVGGVGIMPPYVALYTGSGFNLVEGEEDVYDVYSDWLWRTRVELKHFKEDGSQLRTDFFSLNIFSDSSHSINSMSSSPLSNNEDFVYTCLYQDENYQSYSTPAVSSLDTDHFFWGQHIKDRSPVDTWSSALEYGLTSYNSVTKSIDPSLIVVPEPPMNVCGNDVWETPFEQCDDGNTINGDGCSTTCELEQGVCGDGIQNVEEQCDDGNIVDGDGCSSLCVLEVSADNNSQTLSQEFQNIYNGIDSNFSLFTENSPFEPLVDGDSFYSSEKLGYVLSFTDPNAVIRSVDVLAQSSCFVDNRLYDWENINVSNAPYANDQFGKSLSVSATSDNFIKWWDPDFAHSPESAQNTDCVYQTFIKWNLSDGRSFTVSDNAYNVTNFATAPKKGIFGYKIALELPENSPAFFRNIWKGFEIPFTDFNIGIEPFINFIWEFLGNIFSFSIETLPIIKDLPEIIAPANGTVIPNMTDEFGLDWPNSTISTHLSYKQETDVIAKFFDLAVKTSALIWFFMFFFGAFLSSNKKPE